MADDAAGKLGTVATFVPGIVKGTEYLVDEEGFFYRIGHKPWWNCIEKECHARAKTELKEGEVERLVGKGNSEHNHPSDPAKVGISVTV